MSKRSRALELYSIHGRTSDEVIDYVELLDRIGRLDRVQRQCEVGPRVVALTDYRAGQKHYTLRLVAGTAGEPALFYDTETGEAAEVDTGSRFVANSAWVFVDAVNRLVAVERRRPGVSTLEIESALEQLGVRGGLAANLRIDLNPVAATSFLEEVDRLSRIREASVVLRRPNYDWNDNAADLTGYAEASGGDRVSIEVGAGRGRALSEHTGIVADIRRLVRQPIASLKSVRVRGTREDEQRERTVSLERHQERRYVEDTPGASPLESLDPAADEMFAATAQRIAVQPDGATPI